MQEFLDRFRLEYIKFNNEVLALTIIIWLVTVGCAVSSVISQPYGVRQRAFWVGIIVAFPLVGLLAYLPFSFRKEDMPHIFMRKPSRERRSAIRSQTPKR